MRYTADHAYGYSLQLWRDGDKAFGLFFVASGLAADTPTGLLEDVHFNHTTGKLSFSTKLSIGSVYLGKEKLEPTHDLFIFKGSLKDSVLSGKLAHREKHQPKLTPTIERVTLVKIENKPVIEATSYDEWKHAADQFLDVHGPRW